jgi:hypothetical protein
MGATQRRAGKTPLAGNALPDAKKDWLGGPAGAPGPRSSLPCALEVGGASRTGAALGFGARLCVATPCAGGIELGSTATGAGVGERSAKATSWAAGPALTNMVGPMIAPSSARCASSEGCMSGARTAALVCGTARGGPLGAGPPSAGEASAVGGTSAAAAGTVGADTGEVLLAAVVPVVCGLLPSPPPPPVVPAPAVPEGLVPSLPVFVLSEASAPVMPVFAVPVVCEPSELVPVVVVVLLVPLVVVVVVLLVPLALVVVVLLVLVCVVLVLVPAGDAGSAVAGPGVGGTVVAVASAAAGGSLTGAVGASAVTTVTLVTTVTAVAAVAATDAVASAVVTVSAAEAAVVAADPAASTSTVATRAHRRERRGLRNAAPPGTGCTGGEISRLRASWLAVRRAVNTPLDGVSIPLVSR